MKAAKYAARVKSATIADLKIAPGVLYALADGRYDSAVEGQILKAAETERVDVGRVDGIYVALRPEQQEATSPDRWSETTIEPEPGDGGKCRDVGGGAQRRGPVRAAWHHRQIG